MNGFLIEDGILRKYEGSAEELVIPDEVTSIGAWVFWSDSRLRKVAIPDTVTNIAYGAFYGCSELTEVIIPEKVTGIASEAFAYCSRLKRIDIRPSVCNIRPSAFKDCREDADLFASFALLKGAQQKRKAALTYLRHPEAFSDEHNVEDIKKYILAQKKALLPYIFREDLVNALVFLSEQGKIDKENVNEDYLDPASAAGAYQCVAFLLEWKNRNISFEDEEELLEKELSKDLYNADDMGKFWNYEVLADDTLSISGYKGRDTEIYIPERIGLHKVSRISDGAFFRSEELTSAAIPEEVDSIGKDAFRNCRRLRDIVLPPELSSLGEASFRGCRSLEKITVPDGIVCVGDWSFSSCEELSSVVLPEGLKEIGQHAFSWTRLSAPVIPESVVRIGNNAFAYCRELKSIELPEDLQELGPYVFRGCTSLEKIEIPGSVENIEFGLLENCEALAGVTMGEGIKTIGRSAFSGCSSLKDIVIPYSAVIIDNDAFSRSGLRSIVIPGSVKRIGRFAFSGCVSLRRVEIGAGTEEIDPTAFDGCRDLVICGAAGSKAELFAKNCGMEFETIYD